MKETELVDGKTNHLMPRTILVDRADWERFSRLCQKKDTSVSRALREVMRDAVRDEMKDAWRK